MTTLTIPAERFQHYLALTKPRVVALMVFTAMIGMLLAAPAETIPLRALVFGTIGIALVAGAAAAINCLIEQGIDARMQRTRFRPLPQGQVSTSHTLFLAGVLGGSGLLVLYGWVNALTMWLTLATFLGYAVIYTVFLKPATPQNIVIGGASGAMPPVLGWTAVTGHIDPQALLLFLIIFAWTPPHFWSLALYRAQDYVKSGLPMLPVTHGRRFTQLQIVLYTLILLAVSVLPFAVKMSGWFYLGSALFLGTIFLGYAVALYLRYSDMLARKTFRFSIWYLAALFSALLIDHYLF